jgi:ribosomal protein L37AE/L43A
MSRFDELDALISGRQGNTPHVTFLSFTESPRNGYQSSSMTDMVGFKMQDSKIQKAFCPFCKKNNTHKRKNAYGWHCNNCKVAFRDPLVNEPHEAEGI